MLVHLSTDVVFDGRKGEPYLESDPPNPLGVYARTKLEGEREVRDGWIVRSSWLFGWTGHNFVRTMLRLGAERDEVGRMHGITEAMGAPYMSKMTRDSYHRQNRKRGRRPEGEA